MENITITTTIRIKIINNSNNNNKSNQNIINKNNKKKLENNTFKPLLIEINKRKKY